MPDFDEYVYRLQKDREEILAFLPKGQEPVLDLGTGDGFMAIALARKGFAVTTVDNNPAALRNAEENAQQAGVKTQIRFVEGDAAELPFADESFGAVVSFNMLHHLSSYEGAVREGKRVCSRGGRFLLAELNGAGQEAVQALHRVRGRNHPHRGIKPDILEEMLREDGWTVKSISLFYNTLWIAEKFV